ncbi:MAG: hypothetical protein EBZ77_17130, partial [Chitinophagia bacterium]|nr:hypothetical protein [Chitinophagia bacterium]
TNDSLVLGGDSLVSPRLAPILSGGISGQARVVLPISGGYRRFRFWSHPFVNTIPLSQIQQYVDITGAGGAAAGFQPTFTNMPSAFRYTTLGGNSTLSYDPGWRPYTSALATADDSNKIARYQGMRLYLRGAKGEGLGYDYLTYHPHATKIGQWGTLNQGTQTITLQKGSAAGQPVRGTSGYRYCVVPCKAEWQYHWRILRLESISWIGWAVPSLQYRYSCGYALLPRGGYCL